LAIAGIVTARSFVAKFADMPTAADHVEGSLHEAARIDAAIADGSMSQAEWQALFSKSTFIETGMQPHIATEIAKWADGPKR
jgi:hypothetical protein